MRARRTPPPILSGRRQPSVPASGATKAAAALRFLLSFALGLTLLLGSPTAFAAETRTEVETRRIGVGETFSVRFTVVLGDDDEQPTSPQLNVKGPGEVFGPSVSSQRRVTMRNFNVQSETSVVYTWSVTPEAKGQLLIGPAQVQLGGEILRGQSVRVEVVEGSVKQPPNRRRRSPFGQLPDPFGQDPFGQDPFGRDVFSLGRPRIPDAPEALALEHALDPVAFLIARVDKRNAVLGEPITLEIFAYGGRGNFREISPTEPSLSQFLSYPSVETSHEQPVMQTQIDGKTFLVVKLREMILVPLKTGELTIGPMTAVLRGNAQGYPARGSQLGTSVKSQPLTVEVVEPPESERPPDYQLGDVGRFQLSATLTPDSLTQGDFASLRIEIRGTGNVPSAIHLPEIDGVTWGQPTVKGELEVKNGRLSGSHVLSYTPQFNRAGRIILGALRLPYYDPKARKYRVAELQLNDVQVAPNAHTAQIPSAQQPSDTQPREPTRIGRDAPLEPRDELSAYAPPATPPPVWALVALGVVPPLSWLLTLIPVMAGRLRPGQSGSRRKKYRLDFRRINELAKQGDLHQTARELEQEGYALLEARLSLKGRGILRAHLAHELERAGIKTELAKRLGDLFSELESVRYASAGTQEDAAQSLARRGKELLLQLDRARAQRGRA